jgi:hypothetical protein
MFAPFVSLRRTTVPKVQECHARRPECAWRHDVNYLKIRGSLWPISLVFNPRLSRGSRFVLRFQFHAVSHNVIGYRL